MKMQPQTDLVKAIGVIISDNETAKGVIFCPDALQVMRD